MVGAEEVAAVWAGDDLVVNSGLVGAHLAKARVENLDLVIGLGFGIGVDFATARRGGARRWRRR